MEYSTTLEMIKERRYIEEELWDRLRIIYGRVDAVRQNIDKSLATDDRLWRQHGIMEFRSPYRFPDLTEMENSTPPTWIQWIRREANELCNKLTLVIDQGMNETLLEFRPIPKDVEPEGEQQQDLMGFKTPWPDNAIENRGEEGNSPQRELRQPHHRQQLENVNTTQANVHQVTEMEVNGVTGTEELHRLQPVEVTHEVTQEANGEVLQNRIDEAARGSIEDNTESILNTNSSNN